MNTVLDTRGDFDGIATELATVVRHTLTYGIGGILLKAVSFLLLPFFTHYLGPKEYGIIEILDINMSLLGMVLNMGISNGFLRFYGAAAGPHEQRKLVGTVFSFAVCTATIVFVSGFFFIRGATDLLFGAETSATYLLLSFSNLLLGYISNVPYTYLRAKEASARLVLVDVGAAFTTLMLSIYLIAVLHLSLMGALLSPVIVNVAKTVLLIFWMRKGMIITLDMAIVNKILRFGVPLISFNLMMFTLNFSDRLFLKHYRSLEIVGLYGVGYKFGYMVNFLVIQPFFQMWQARMYQIRERSEYATVFPVVFIMFSLLLVFSALGISLFSLDIARNMLDARYSSSSQIMGLIAFGYVILGIAYFVQLGMFLESRTGLIGAVSGVAALLNLAANYFLIIHFGMLGAAWATIIGFLALAIGSHICSQRVFPLELPVGRVCKGLAMAGAIYATSRMFVIPIVSMSILVNMIFWAVFPVVVWTSVLAPNEKALLRSLRFSASTIVSRLFATSGAA